MKPFGYLSMLLFMIVTNIPSAFADQAKTVRVSNNTTYTLTEFYASSSDSSTWNTSNNLLAGQTIAPGQGTTITIAGGGDDDTCNYDLMAVLYGAAEHAYKYQVYTCNGDSASWTVQ